MNHSEKDKERWRINSRRRRQEKKAEILAYKKEWWLKSGRVYRLKNIERIREQQRDQKKRKRNELAPVYVKQSLKKWGFTVEEINQYPELIEILKTIIKTKRSLKNLKNDNISNLLKRHEASIEREFTRLVNWQKKTAHSKRS